MSALGWLFMVVAVAAVVGVILFCADAFAQMVGYKWEE